MEERKLEEFDVDNLYDIEEEEKGQTEKVDVELEEGLHDLGFGEEESKEDVEEIEVTGTEDSFNALFEEGDILEEEEDSEETEEEIESEEDTIKEEQEDVEESVELENTQKEEEEGAEYDDNGNKIEYSNTWFDEEEGYGEVAETVEDAMENKENYNIEDDLDGSYEFFDKDGNPINARRAGPIHIDYIDIDKILIPSRNRTEPRNITELEESIKTFHLLVPIQVIPFDDDEYVLIDGNRRLHAMINLGHSQIMAIVDDTINPHAVRPFESLINNRLQYTIMEKFKAGRFIEKRQEGFSYETIEDMVGFKPGEYLKMLFVQQMSDSFPDIYEKVMLEKMTPEQAEKKINKELEKADEEGVLDEIANEKGEGEEGTSREDENPFNQQNKEERSILDSNLKTSVLTRDYGVCQCCGEGIDEPEVSQLMKIHHIVPVELFGPDRRDNLITLCANCHDKVHYYDEARYLPDGELPNNRKNAIILGNMLQELRDKAQDNDNSPIDGMAHYDESPYQFYLDSAYQSDFIEDAEDNVLGNTYGEVKKVNNRRARPKLKNTKKDMMEK